MINYWETFKNYLNWKLQSYNAMNEFRIFIFKGENDSIIKMQNKVKKEL